MEIRLKQRDIEEAIRAHLVNMGIARPVSSMDFTAGRGNTGLTVDIGLSLNTSSDSTMGSSEPEPQADPKPAKAKPGPKPKAEATKPVETSEPVVDEPPFDADTLAGDNQPTASNDDADQERTPVPAKAESKSLFGN